MMWNYEEAVHTLDSRGLSDDDDEPPNLPQLLGFRLGRKDIFDDEPLLLFSLEDTLLLLDRLVTEDLRLGSELSSPLFAFLAGRFGGFLRFNTSLSLLWNDKNKYC